MVEAPTQRFNHVAMTVHPDRLDRDRRARILGFDHGGVFDHGDVRSVSTAAP